MDHSQTTPATADPSLADKAARLAVYEAQAATARADSIAYWIRRLTAEIAREGIPRVGRQITVYTFETPEIQWHVWLLDSLLWAFEEIQAGRALYAFRGLLQAAGYAGHLGRNPTPTGDAYLTLRNLLEDIVRKGEGS